jgi:hypothetical protein
MPRGGRRQRLTGPIQDAERCFTEIARRVQGLATSLIPYFYNRNPHFVLATVVEDHSVPLVLVSPTIPRNIIHRLGLGGSFF